MNRILITDISTFDEVVQKTIMNQPLFLYFVGANDEEYGNQSWYDSIYNILYVLLCEEIYTLIIE